MTSPKKIKVTQMKGLRGALTEHKATLLKIADELLLREVLDAEQVRKITKGEPLEDLPAPVLRWWPGIGL